MMPPPKAASKMAVVVQALLVVVDAESGERPQISAGLVPDSVFQCDGRRCAGRDGEFKRDARLVGAMETPCSLAEQTLVRPGACRGFIL